MWIKWASKEGIWNYNIWLLLIHQEVPLRHWSLLIVIPQLQKFVYFDSLHGQPPKNLISHLCAFMNKFRGSIIRSAKTSILWSRWTLHIPDDVPRQGLADDTGNNCGAHLCSWVYLICRSDIEHFTDFDMINVRKNIAKLIYDYSEIVKVNTTHYI